MSTDLLVVLQQFRFAREPNALFDKELSRFLRHVRYGGAQIVKKSAVNPYAEKKKKKTIEIRWVEGQTNSFRCFIEADWQVSIEGPIATTEVETLTLTSCKKDAIYSLNMYS